MRIRRLFITLSAPLIALAFITSCFLPVEGFREPPKTTQPPKPAPKKPPEPHAQPRTEQPPRPKKAGGVYHTVQRGETIYRISKIYDISQDAIIAANGIQDVTKVRVGQVLFIPGGKKAGNTQVAFGDNNQNPPPRVPPTNPPVNPPTNPPVNPPDNPPVPEPPPANDNGDACSPAAAKFNWPATGTLSSMFGMRNSRQHDGIDICGPIGTPIYAVADGVVIFSDRLGGYGMIVIVKHEGELKSIYAHNRKNLVQKGAIVKQGDLIAELGNSGNATGPHLHFEVRCGQEAVDPMPFLPKR